MILTARDWFQITCKMPIQVAMCATCTKGLSMSELEEFKRMKRPESRVKDSDPIQKGVGGGTKFSTLRGLLRGGITSEVTRLIVESFERNS